MKSAGPVNTDIVLVGGGHAHVHVLTAFAMRPEPGVRLTLVTRDLETPYSGMLPGVIAGLYTSREAHIDLVRLAAATGTRLIHAEACGLDRGHKRVMLKDRPSIAYDLVSIDVGITPTLDAIEGAPQHAIAVKPIGHFISKFKMLMEEAKAPGGVRRIAVIGGGAGGVELLLSVRSRILRELETLGLVGAKFEFALVADGEILPSHASRVRASFRNILKARAVDFHENARAVAVRRDGIVLADGDVVPADRVLVATRAAPPGWFKDSGLTLDGDGFVAVGPTLQSLNDSDVFAAGDCAALTESPREKAGVYAVRAGPPLARNLRLRARGRGLKPWRPQRRHLALISTGERYAIASRGWFKAEGAWLWTVKDWIDRRWMRMYQDVDRMIAKMSTHGPAIIDDGQAANAMRCGGCAAKIGPGPLSRALARLTTQVDERVIIGLGAPDDAAVIAAPENGLLVQTVDFFRSFIDDPYLFGAIAANHALNDIFAMGGSPRYALATAVIPAGPPIKVEENLYQVLSGARTTLDREGVTLVGGHSAEGVDLAVGFSVAGEVAPDRFVRKGGLRAGDVLVLTKPIGTGVLFAGAMRAKADAADIEAAIAEMRRSNRRAAEILVTHGAMAMTDVSGFGLAGHLGEMLSASGCTAALELSKVPVYHGVWHLVRQGIASTLLPENLALRDLVNGDIDAPGCAVLFDPQTAGGLLAGVPGPRAQACVSALREDGYQDACAIGRVTQATSEMRNVGILVRGAFDT
jgi:selenide,water dikinase